MSSQLEQAFPRAAFGKASDAKITLVGDEKCLALYRDHKDDLRELLNVSALSFEEPDPKMLYKNYPVLDLPHIEVAKASGQKCERCWHWEEDVGVAKDHPTLCARCVEAVEAVTR